MKKEFVKGEPLIVAKSVSKQLGGKIIIRNIGAENAPFVVHDVSRPNMQQGQTVGVVGASGTGKSTFFKLLSGIYAPTSGTITVPNTSDVKSVHRPVKGGDVGFVQQSYPLSRNQNVRNMLLDAARQGGIKSTDRERLVDEYLNEWGLYDKRFNAKNQLSGGQKQRVAIIEQLLCSHHFIIFDEPFSGLDVKNIEDVKTSFKKITTVDEMNTIIFSTHDIHLAVELSDTIVVMGYERDGVNIIPGGTIVKEYNLMELGLAWDDTYTSAHRELASDIQQIIKQS